LIAPAGKTVATHKEDEIVVALHDATVVRDLRMAEAWLRREIGPEAATLERCQDLALTAIRTDGAGSRRAASIKA